MEHIEKALKLLYDGIFLYNLKVNFSLIFFHKALKHLRRLPQNQENEDVYRIEFELHYCIALVYITKSKKKETLKYINKAHEIVEKMQSKQKLYKGRIYDLVAHLCLLKFEYEDALKYALDSLEAKSDIHDNSIDFNYEILILMKILILRHAYRIILVLWILDRLHFLDGQVLFLPLSLDDLQYN